jgi:accessory gene regulator B
MIISNIIIDFFMRSIADSFEQDDLDKVKYSLQVILWETEKIILLGLIFAYLGKFQYFLSTTLVLVSIKAFTGGYHAKSSLTCFILSLAIFSISILLAPSFSISFEIMVLLVACIFIFSLFFPALPSVQLPKSMIKASVQKKRKLLSTLFTLFWLLLILINHERPLSLSWLCIIYLQNGQLCIEYIRRKVIRFETKLD